MPAKVVSPIAEIAIPKIPGGISAALATVTIPHLTGPGLPPGAVANLIKNPRRLFNPHNFPKDPFRPRPHDLPGHPRPLLPNLGPFGENDIKDEKTNQVKSVDKEEDDSATTTTKPKTGSI